MSNFLRVNLPGWAPFEVLTSAQMNALDIDHANSINGAGGGNYAPSSIIDIAGAGLRVSGPFESSGGATLTGGIVVAAGTAIFAGDIFGLDDLTITDLLTVQGQSNFLDDVFVTGDLDVSSDFTAATATITLGTFFALATASLTASGTVTMNGAVNWNGPGTLTGRVVKSVGGRFSDRIKYADNVDDVAYDVGLWDEILILSWTADRTLRLINGTQIGERIRVVNATSHTANVANQGGAGIAGASGTGALGPQDAQLRPSVRYFIWATNGVDQWLVEDWSD